MTRRTRIRPAVPVLGAALVPILGGCAGVRPAPPVAAISHVVFVDLIDPADAPELIADAEAMLATIPSVASCSAGPHFDMGRDTVLSDYDVGIVLGFDDAEALDAYVKHPEHQLFVSKWRPRLDALRVYDIADAALAARRAR